MSYIFIIFFFDKRILYACVVKTKHKHNLTYILFRSDTLFTTKYRYFTKVPPHNTKKQIEQFHADAIWNDSHSKNNTSLAGAMNLIC